MSAPDTQPIAPAQPTEAQPPATPPTTEAQPPATTPPKKKKTGLIMGVVVIVVILVVVIAAVMMMSQSKLVGKWNLKQTVTNGNTTDVPASIGAGIEFKSNGDFTMTTLSSGSNPTVTGQWKDLGGGKVRLTISGGSIDIGYTVNGNKLTLDMSDSTWILEKA